MRAPTRNPLAGHRWPSADRYGNSWVFAASLVVAANVAVTKTPIGSTLVVTEMAGMLLPTTLHSVARQPGPVVADRAHRDPAATVRSPRQQHRLED